MKVFFTALFILCLNFLQCQAQRDTVFLMNGHIFGAQVLDSSGGMLKVISSLQPTKQLVYTVEQLYKVRYANGKQRYYYEQDSIIGNWLSREDMWLYMKGEQDARKGFKARGAIIGATCAGLIGGMSGTFWGPIAPYGFMALSGIPKIRIRHKTVSDLNLLKTKAYVMGYERVARQKMKLKTLLAGTIGLAAGYGIYAVANSYYPETINIGINR